jgi:hypothetical protein
MRDRDDALPDDAQRLVEAYRRVTVPSARERHVLLERLLADGAAPRGPGRLVASIGISLALAAAVLLLLRGGHAAITATRAERARSDAAMHEARADGDAAKAVDAPPPRWVRPPPQATSPAIEPPAIAPPAIAPPAIAPPATERAPQLATPPARRTVPSSPGSDDEGERLREEGRLLARAQQALAAGQPADALRVLEQHRRSFPTGALMLERRALEAVALCQAGRRDEGRTLAQTLLAEHSGAPHRQRIARACGE